MKKLARGHSNQDSNFGERMMKATMRGQQEVAVKTEQALTETHTLSEHDLSKVDAFIKSNRFAGTLRVDYVNGGKTRVRFVQEFPVEVS